MTQEHVEHTDVVIIGGGQAGIAMSEHLTAAAVPHVVLEKDRVAERWRTARWDSLVANGPAWHDRFPGLEFPGRGPDEFVPKEEVADYLAAYAERFGAPIRTGVEATAVVNRSGTPGFVVETTQGPIETRCVVVATGPFQNPVIPPIVPDEAPVTQIHSNDYRSPAALPDGAVLVVGSGSSGVQIAAELREAGREVYLSVSPHDRPPRSYRGRDFVWWLGVLGLWEAATPAAGAEHVTIAVSGAKGGRTVDFRDLAADGIRLVGRTIGYHDGAISFAPDLATTIAAGDANYLSLLEAADLYVERNGLDLPAEPEAHELGDDPADVTEPVTEVDLAAAGISTIVWATGFRPDYAWLHVNALDEDGRPNHRRGVSAEPGVYFIGLPWQSRRGSSFIWGVWHDAKYVSDQIMIQRGYAAYVPDIHPLPHEESVLAR